MAATDIERLVVQIEGQTAKFEKALARMEGRSAASAKKVEKTFASMQQRMDSSFAAVGSSLKGALAIAGIGLGASNILQYVDAWTKATNALKVAGLSGTELTGTLDALYAAAQRQGAPLEAITTLYGRAAAAQKELKATSGELIQFTEDVAVALRVAGTAPEEASGALLQLGQLLGSARVQAEEFNSVNEGARPILQAVANGIQEAGGSVSKLKQLVTEGSISNVAFFKGFQAGAQSIRDQAASAEPTVSQAFTRMQNAIIKLVGEVNSATGFSRSFVNDLDAIAAGAKRAEGPIQFLIDVLRKLNELQDYANKNGLQLGVKLNDALYGNGNGSVSDLRGAMKGYDYKDTVKTSNEFDKALGFSNPYPPTKSIRAADYPVVGAKPKGGGNSETQYASETRQLHERTQALELEAETLGKSTYEVERAKTAMDLLNAAKSDGTKITPDVLAGINAEAEAYARAAEKVEKAKEAYKLVGEVQDGLASAFSGSISAIAKGESAIDALTNSLGRLMDQLLDMIAKQIFKQLFQSIGASGFGFSSGGTVGGTSGASYVKAADGGAIRGPGSARSDSIPAMLSNGEFVVNAAMAKRYGALLEAINSGKFRLPRFATGGSVGGPVSRSSGVGGDMIVNIQNNGAQVETRESRRGNSRVLDVIVEQKLNSAISSGKTDKSNFGRFGLRPSPTRRG